MATKPRKTRRANAPPAAAEIAARTLAGAAAPQGQQINMTTEQVQQAAAAGNKLLSLETTLTPGNLRQQVAVLEVVLQGIMTGNLVVVTPQQLAVESGPQGDSKPTG